MKPQNTPPYHLPTAVETLLVADGNDITQYTLRKSLQPMYNVITARNGIQALAMAINHKPSLVIANLKIDGLDGFVLCEKLKNNFVTNNIPVIVITSNYDVNMYVNGFNLGADDIIQIPFDVNELRARIGNRITMRKKLQAQIASSVRQNNEEINAPSMEEKFLQSVIEVISKFMSDQHFNVNQFAREVGVSNAQLYRKLHTLTGYAPNDFIRNMRLERAMKLLTGHTGNISEIAYRVGFSNLSYFSKCFREKFGVAPSRLVKSGVTKIPHPNPGLYPHMEFQQTHFNILRYQAPA